MKNLKKSHWLLIALSILILAGTIGITAFLLFSNYQNVRLFKQAQNNFLRGDIESLMLAEAQLLQLTRNDNDHEAAYITLGAIAEKRKFYPEQVYYCYMAHRLNPLSTENRNQYVKSLWFARYFDRLENFLAPRHDLSDKEKQLLLYSAGRNGNINKYKYPFSRIASNKSIGELAFLLFKQKDLSLGEKIAALDKMKGDDFTEQEILAAKAELHLETGNITSAEKALLAAHKLNPYAFAPALGRFHATFRSFASALSVFERHLATYHDPVIALQTAEIYCLLKRTADLQKLRNQYQSDSGSQAMMLCYYLDALIAFSRDDLPALQELLIPLRKNIKTPLALFLFFCADLQEKNLSAIRETYTELITRRGYKDLQDRADIMLSDFLKSNLTAFQGKEEQILALANQLYARKKEAFTAKLILLSPLEEQNKKVSLLNDALKRFPHDPGLIKIAIEHYFTRDLGEYEKLIAYYKKKFPQKTAYMFRYELILGVKKNDFNAVSALFRKHYSPAILTEYWNFASTTMREDDLRFLSRDPLYAPYCRALLLIKKGDKKAACDILEKSEAQGNPSLLFFAAKTLAENGRNHAARDQYGKIPDQSPFQLDILLNSAEIFAEIGNPTRASDLAAEAYRMAPDLPDVQLCYADKLYRNEQWSKIPDVIRLSSTSPHRKRMEFLWTAGMRQRILECDLNVQQERARELCRQLLSVVPDDSTALECLKKLNKMPQ